MKLPWEKKHICWGIIAFLTFAASTIFYMTLQKWEAVKVVIDLILKSLSPITYGLILAYILNPLVNVIEYNMVYPLAKRIAKQGSKRVHSISRTISIFVAWTVTIIIILMLLALVIPELSASIESLLISMPEYANQLIEHGASFLEKNPQIFQFLQTSVSGLSTNAAEIMNKLNGLIPNLNILLTNITSSVYNAVTAILNILIGIIVSIYVLKDKEKFFAQFKRILYSMLSVKKANNVIAVSRLTHDKFGNFITGKIFDSMIIGVLCFVVLSLFNMPYIALISVIVGVTNVIPFFGPFIGAIPSALLILFAEPSKCLTFIIIIIALQQFDGNILGPKILGSTTGISSFWVMFSILIGSGLFGIWGMICAVPLFAVVYTLVREYCHRALRKKGIDYTSETFEKIDHIEDDTKAPVWLDRD